MFNIPAIDLFSWPQKWVGSVKRGLVARSFELDRSEEGSEEGKQQNISPASIECGDRWDRSHTRFIQVYTTWGYMVYKAAM